MDRPDMSARPGYDRMDSRFIRPGRPPVDDEEYRGDWSTWVDRPPGAPQPAFEPEFESYQDEFDSLIDRSRSLRAKRRWAPPLLGTLGSAALAFAAVTHFWGDGVDQQADRSAPTQANAATAAPATRCAAERVGNRIQGNGVGGFDSGPAAIFAFQHAYYVTRSGEQARAAATATAAVPTADAIQQGIDSIPAGTTHCLAITPGAFVGQYVVVITEHRPGHDPLAYNPQIVTTTTDGSRTLISAISRG
ncbi:hypothetical protein AB0B25_06675 [Nocardia sp. NPDC049190]|uniref:hypothetical protein n=1 Tax=Nocardia sp. NPDC049190 TaxID=3155650 RepID=UPI0033DB6C13